MAVWTLAEATAQLDAWKAASLAIAKNQSYKIRDREFTRADARHIKQMLDYFSVLVGRLTYSQGGIRARQFVMRD